LHQAAPAPCEEEPTQRVVALMSPAQVGPSPVSLLRARVYAGGGGPLVDNVPPSSTPRGIVVVGSAHLHSPTPQRWTAGSLNTSWGITDLFWGLVNGVSLLCAPALPPPSLPQRTEVDLSLFSRR
jgi:hypothetical protein